MKKLALFLLALFCLPLAACSAAVPAAPGGAAVLTFPEIGKGDAMLLTAPDGSRYLIDTGKEEDYAALACTLRAKGVTALEAVILTHGHKDHMGGLDQLLSAFPVKVVYCGGQDTESYDSGEPKATVAGRAALRYLNRGDTLDLGGVRAEVLAPYRVDTAEENNNSLVLRLTWADRILLLMGDAEAAVETQLLENGVSLQADLLKVGHHGKDDASTAAFLEAVRPAFAVIPCGYTEEEEGAPGAAVLERLRALGAETLPVGREPASGYTDFTVTAAGVARSLQPVSAWQGLQITALDTKAEWVQLTNGQGRDLELSGCRLISGVGGEEYIFPAGTVLKAGASLTVASGGGSGTLFWTADKVWKNKKADPALLYDPQGLLVDALGK